MPRHRERKTNYGSIAEDVMRSAVKAILVDSKKLREVARDFNIPKSTLARYVAKSKDVEWGEDPLGKDITFIPNYACRQIFSSDEEVMLKDYLTQASQLHHGLPATEARKLAYEFAVYKNKKIPSSWVEHKCAGEDWLFGYMKRVKELSLRKPEATSLALCMGFNKPVVMRFYDKLAELMEKHSFPPENIYNIDETGVTTVQTPGKVIAKKGAKQVGQVTSAERGDLVTVCCTINALGNSVPPFFIFPRARYLDPMLHGAPVGSEGSATPSGWMTSPVFLNVLQHFIKHFKSSIENKTLLIMDNHESHVAIEAINLAKQNGVELFTIPPHSSHKLQPLDKGVFGTLKRYFNEACRSWLLNHPGKRISIHQIAELVGVAYPNAFSISNIRSGFHHTGIYPYNKDYYKDPDFSAAMVTDTTHQSPALNVPQEQCSRSEISEAGPSAAGLPAFEPPITHSSIMTPSFEPPPPAQSEQDTPEAVRPLPKVVQEHGKEIGKKRGRKAKQSEVLTDTPVKQRIEEDLKKRQDEKARLQERKENRKIKQKEKAKLKPVSLQRKKRKLSRQLWDDTSSEEGEWKESESENEWIELNSEDEDEVNEPDLESKVDKPESCEYSSGDFVLVKIIGKKSSYFYYVAEILKVNGNSFDVKYMRRSEAGYSFIFDDKHGVYQANLDDIVLKLPTPTEVGGTARTLSKLSFSVNFNSYGSSLK